MAGWELRGDVLAERRAAAGLSQAALGRAIALSNSFRIGLWERGVAAPKPRWIPLLARVLGVDALMLLDGDPGTPDLTHLRIAAGLSVGRAARCVGMSQASYQRLEYRGVPEGGLPPEVVAGLANGFGISLKQTQAAVDRQDAAARTRQRHG